jgi:hypothetical protein
MTLDARAQGPGLLRKVYATAGAAVVATTITTVLVAVVTSVEALLWIVGMRNASPELKSLMGFDFSQAISAWPLEALRDVAFAPLLGAVFGFVGAFVFLGVGFLFVRAEGRADRRYVIGGAIIGFVHSAVGFSLRGVELLPWDLRMAVEPLTGWVGLLGGFLVIAGARPLAVLATFIAAPIAGAIAGLAFSRMFYGSVRSPVISTS